MPDPKFTSRQDVFVIVKIEDEGWGSTSVTVEIAKDAKTAKVLQKAGTRLLIAPVLEVLDGPT